MRAFAPYPVYQHPMPALQVFNVETIRIDVDHCVPARNLRMGQRKMTVLAASDGERQRLNHDRLLTLRSAIDQPR